jgi:hypothetical protein
VSGSGAPARQVDQDHAPRRVDPRVVEGCRRPEPQPRLPLGGPRPIGRPFGLEHERLLVEVVPERKRRLRVVGEQVLDGRQLLRSGNRGRDRLVVLEPVDLAHAPHHRVEDRAVALRNLDPLGHGGTAAFARRDPDVDGFELRNAQVVTRERRRSELRRRRARGA